MKALIRKLIPGVVATLVATALGMYCMARAQDKATAAAPAAPPSYAAAPTYNQGPAAAPQQIMVCGVCGAQLQQPQVVMIAPGYPDQQRPRQARAEYSERYAVDAYYPQPAACVEPVAYAPAYYQRPLSADPFSEIRVNPIPFPYQTRAIYVAPQGREHFRH